MSAARKVNLRLLILNWLKMKEKIRKRWRQWSLSLIRLCLPPPLTSADVTPSPGHRMSQDPGVLLRPMSGSGAEKARDRVTIDS